MVYNTDMKDDCGEDSCHSASPLTKKKGWNNGIYSKTNKFLFMALLDDK